MKHKLFCLFLFLSASAAWDPSLYAARKNGLEKTLRRYFKTLCKTPGARVDAVEYTGGFSQEIRG